MAPACKRLRELRPPYRAWFRSAATAEQLDDRESAALGTSMPPIGASLAADDIERDIARLLADLPPDHPELIAANDSAEAERAARLWETVGQVLAKEQPR